MLGAVRGPVCIQPQVIHNHTRLRRLSHHKRSPRGTMLLRQARQALQEPLRAASMVHPHTADIRRSNATRTFSLATLENETRPELND